MNIRENITQIHVELGKLSSMLLVAGQYEATQHTAIAECLTIARGINAKLQTLERILAGVPEPKQG